MANFAAAFEAALDGGALDSGATASFVGSNKMAANVADKLTSNTSNNHNTISSPPSRPPAIALRRLRREETDAVAAAAAATATGRTRTRTPRPRMRNASTA